MGLGHADGLCGLGAQELRGRHRNRNRALDRVHDRLQDLAGAGDHQGAGRADARNRRPEDAFDDTRLQRGRRHGAAAHCGRTADDQPGSAEQTLLQGRRGQYRQQDGKLAALSVDLGAEVTAAFALAKMPPQVRAAQRRAATRRYLLADLRTRRVASRALGDERLARLENQPLHLVSRHSEHAGDVLVRQGIKLREHQRRALFLGEPAQVGDQIPEVLSALDLDREAFGSGSVDRRGRLLAASADDRVAAIPGDRVEPRAHLDRVVRVGQLAVRGHERVLDSVLGLVGVTEHVTAEGQDPPVMAIVKCLECARASLANPAHQPCIGGQSDEPRRRRQRSGTRKCARFHVVKL